MVRVLGRAALRFLAVVVVAVTFAFVMEAIWPRPHPDPRSLVAQYVAYWTNLLEPTIAARIANALPWSVATIGTASVCAFVVGTILGARMARPGGRRMRGLLSLPVMILATVPAFLIAMVLVAILAQRLRLLPPALGFSPTQTWRDPVAVAVDLLSHAIVPVVTIALSGIGLFALAMRGATVMLLHSDHALYAHALGLSERKVFWAHEARLALIPVVTALGISLGLIVAGALLVEAILSYPGIGWMLWLAVQAGDMPMMRGIMLVLIVALALATTFVDLLLPRLDPRLRRA